MQAALKLDHISIHVRELSESCDFYQRVLGLREIPCKVAKAHIRWFDFGDGRELHVIGGCAEPLRQHRDIHLALATSDFDGSVAHLQTQGVEHLPVRRRVDGFRQTYFQDPDGYWIEINDVP